MTTHIVINGKEITNPIAKAALVVGAILIAALITVVIVFVLLPVVGIAITLTIGFVAVFFVAILAGIATLLLSTAVFGWMFGPTEFRIKTTHIRK